MERGKVFMILCRVIGNAVSTVKHPVYVGKSIMVLQPVQTDTHTKNGREFLAIDSVSAGPGDLVMAAREGNTARQILGTDRDPFHSVIVGIVDHVEDTGKNNGK
jgi:microcompartment protein CcmK/EutM